MAITKAERIHRVGSFGTPTRAGERGDELTSIWFCGAKRERNGSPQDRCAHRTRKEALACPHRAEAEKVPIEWTPSQHHCYLGVHRWHRNASTTEPEHGNSPAVQKSRDSDRSHRSLPPSQFAHRPLAL